MEKTTSGGKKTTSGAKQTRVSGAKKTDIGREKNPARDRARKKPIGHKRNRIGRKKNRVHIIVVISFPPTNRSHGGQTQSCSFPAAVTFQGAFSPNLHTLRPLHNFHQLIDLTGAKQNHAVFQRPLPQGCRLS